jgi:hypothetical protein
VIFQVGENKTKLQGLSTNILNSLQRIERIMATHEEEILLAPDLQEPLGQLEMYVPNSFEDAESPLFNYELSASCRLHFQGAKGGISVETDWPSIQACSWTGRTGIPRRRNSLDLNRM